MAYTQTLPVILMKMTDIIFNNFEFKRAFEIHLSKAESIERLEELINEHLYKGEFTATGFKLIPKQKFSDFYSFYDTQIIGKFIKDEIPGRIEITVKKTSFSKLGSVIFDSMLLFMVISIMLSDNELQSKLVVILFAIIGLVVNRYSSKERVDKSGKVFLGYLSYLFKPIELRIKE